MLGLGSLGIRVFGLGYKKGGCSFTYRLAWEASRFRAVMSLLLTWWRSSSQLVTSLPELSSTPFWSSPSCCLLSSSSPLLLPSKVSTSAPPLVKKNISFVSICLHIWFCLCSSCLLVRIWIRLCVFFRAMIGILLSSWIWLTSLHLFSIHCHKHLVRFVWSNGSSFWIVLRTKFWDLCFWIFLVRSPLINVWRILVL